LKHLVLAGGGHAHLQVLRAYAKEPVAAARVTLVSPHPELVYSGMVPGLVAGHYRREECAIALSPWARAAKAEFIAAAATGLDAGARRLVLSDGRTLAYDALSLDTGGVMDRDAIPGARAHALFVRPIEHFARVVEDLLARSHAAPLHVVTLGGGAAGVELALALQQRLGRDARVSLVTGGPPPLAGYPLAVQQRARRALRRHGITVFEHACAHVDAQRVVLAGQGGRLACDAAVAAIGSVAPPWVRESGLALDAQGYVATGPTLQSLSHPEVFAAGDVASRPDAPHPRSGVYALHAGPALALNLRRHVAGGALEPYVPQRKSLNLISCGRRYAIASWNGWSGEGRWVWWWKDRIDRKFVQGFAGPAR
jgi:pyridine nucleotide-disulfide oxidoreductase family protein